MEGVCQSCRDQVFNRKAMTVLWTQNADAEKENKWLEGHKILFVTSKAHIEAGLQGSCPFCCLLRDLMLDDLEPKDEVYGHREDRLKDKWAKGHRKAIWFGFDQIPPFGLARLYITDEGAGWSNIGYQIYTTLGNARLPQFSLLASATDLQ